MRPHTLTRALAVARSPTRRLAARANSTAAGAGPPGPSTTKQLLTLHEIDRLLTSIARSSSPSAAASPLVMRAHAVPWLSSASPDLDTSAPGTSSTPAASGSAAASTPEPALSEEERQALLRPKHMSESYTTFTLPLASDAKLYERYVNTSGGFRMGKLLEHLDSLAGAVAYRHCLPPPPPDADPSQSAAEAFHDASARAGLYLATASADRLDMFGRLNRENVRDLTFSGFVTWTGSSSMEVFIKMEGARPGSDETATLMLGRFSMVCRDSRTHKARRVPPLVVETDEERVLWAIGEEHKRTKTEHSKRSLDKVPPSSAETADLHALMLAAARSDTIGGEAAVPMRETEMESVQLMFPQDRNLHGKVFGGILMRLAFELAFTNAAIFASRPMRFLALDQITFRLPVPIGAVLRLSARVVKTARPGEGGAAEARAHVTVRAEVEEVETGTNTFFFTLAPEDARPIGRTVVPETYAEAMAYLEGQRRLAVGEEMRGLYSAIS